MAIFDSEKRPRGLRVPSLSKIKAGASRKKSEPKSPDTDDEPSPPLPALDFDLVPVVNSTLRLHPPPTKELPSPPKDQLPPPIQISTQVPARRELSSNTRPVVNPQTLARGIRPAGASPVSPLDAHLQHPPPIQTQTTPAVVSSTAAYPQAAYPQAAYQQSAPQGAYQQVAATPTYQLAPPQPLQPLSPESLYSPTTIQAANKDESISPTDTSAPEADNVTPLEDFIPTPESDTSPVEPVDNQPFLPSDYEPVAAPLNQLHYNCFQEHKSMPVAQNQWYSLPCMTCQKFDREVRHRCVFCCLRICGSCHKSLQKLQNHSLGQLMKNLESVE
ncbi:hypothetical protein N7495_002934 [Penicillium taxi]|uniref:uncharacterized protein n=1 Tax=Penicillium taxi TaxID=168475 RepID=UPI0025458F8B|nr:uncharacterized protein N7495_002934 [Penicillium taxi]KAJ5902406.1 hypothetical protein N7495_002934 [Penicillium taxi]